LNPRNLSLAGAVAAAAFNGLTDHAPKPRLKLVDRSPLERRPRALTDAQRGTLLGLAAERIAEEAQDRACRWLRRLDTIHISGVRTKRQRWDALAKMAEPLLARLDLATLALGWLDSQTGAFRLNRQRGLAEDTGLSECCVSRTLTALEAAGYLRRRVRRIFKHGKHWVSRVTIHIRPRFFIDLGLGHQLAEERTRKKAKRDKVLAALGMQKSRDRLQAIADQFARKRSHLKATQARAKQEAERAEQQRQDRERARAAAWASFAAEPDVQALPRRKQMALFGQRFPDLI
jgi:hypothetical protein